MRTALRVIIATYVVMWSTSSFAQDAPRRMRERAPLAPTSHLRQTVYRDLFAVWGRDADGHRVMCATFHDGTISCHSPGVVRRRVSIAEAASGAALIAGGLVTIAMGDLINNPICFDLWDSEDGTDSDCGGSGDGGPWIGVGSALSAVGASLLCVGVVRGVERRRAFRWLRARHAAMAVSARSGSGSLSFRLSL